MFEAGGAVIFEFVLRWLHIVAGVIWIGHLYFFNFVNVAFAKTMDGETKKKVIPELMPRALFFFRWGAMVTFITGWIYIAWKIHGSGKGMAQLTDTAWGWWIGTGATFGTIMWFNVWFIIWPIQQKVITWIRNGEAPPEMAGMARKAYLASRTNTYLSVPLLFAMAAATHYPVQNVGEIILFVLVGLGAAHGIIAHSNIVSNQV